MNGWTLAILAEGYTADDEPLFEQHVAELEQALFALPPFDQPTIQEHVHLVGEFFASGDRGADVGLTGLGHSTAFSVGLNSAGGIRSYWRRAKQFSSSRQRVPGRDASLLLVNDDRGGGMVAGNHGVALRNNVDAIRDAVDQTLGLALQAQSGFPNTSDRWGELQQDIEVLTEVRDATTPGLTPYRTAIHEIGHLLGLLDEYDGKSNWHIFDDPWVLGTGRSPNTARQRRWFNEIGWTNQYDHPGRSPVIWENPNCSSSKTNQGIFMPRDLAEDLDFHHVGIIEGARTRNCKRLKPSFDCIMNAHRVGQSPFPTLANNRFCVVCEAALERRILETAG